MLKSVLYCLILAMTSARLVDIIYLLATHNTNLPVPVIVVAFAMIVYGICIVVRKFFANVTLKQMMAFFMIEIVAIVFNLSYVAVASPLRISVPETLLVGTFLDIIVNCGVVYFCAKQIRSRYFAIAQPAVTSNRNS